LIDEETDELYMRAGQGLGKKFATGFRLKSEDSLSWQVVRTGKPIMISSVADEERFKVKTGYLVKALLHVPLKVRGEVIGVLSVDNKIASRSFSDNDLHLLSALSDYAAIAIDNARLYSRAEAKAARLNELFAAQEARPAPAPDLAPAPVETTPPDWLVEEIEARKKLAQEGLSETQKVLSELTTQRSAIEGLIRWWRDQQTQSDRLVRELTGDRVEGVTPANLQKILDTLGEGLLLTDPAGRIKQANDAAMQMLGTSSLEGENVSDLSSSAHWTSSIDRLNRDGALDKGTWLDITFWENERLIKATLVPLTEAQENKGWAVVLKDLSRTRAGPLIREDMAASISQEMRTPMTVLTSYTDLLLAETVGLLVPVQQRLLQRMRANLNRMGKTLNNLTTVPHLEREEEPEPFLPVDLTSVLQEALNKVKPEIDAKQLNVNLHVDDPLPRAAAEPDCVYQMITNLLQNAIRATPSGGTIGVRAEVGPNGGPLPQAPHLVVAVRDEGGGIAPELLGQIFGHFFSEDDHPIPGLGGRGVELVAVKRLVEAFGGRVWVETEPQVGSTFSFVLPAVDGRENR
jgi:signal transduction histidine kinase